jgi:hypothetical protein
LRIAGNPAPGIRVSRHAAGASRDGGARYRPYSIAVAFVDTVAVVAVVAVACERLCFKQQARPR